MDPVAINHYLNRPFEFSKPAQDLFEMSFTVGQGMHDLQDLNRKCSHQTFHTGLILVEGEHIACLR